MAKTTTKGAQFVAKMRRQGKSALDKAITEEFGLKVPPKGKRPRQPRVKGIAVKLHDSTETETKAGVAAEEPVSGDGVKVAEDTAVIIEAGVLPSIDVPEVLPAAPGHELVDKFAGTALEGRALKVARRARALQLRLNGLDYRDIKHTIHAEMCGDPHCPAMADTTARCINGRKWGLKTLFYDVQQSLVYLARIDVKLTEDVRNLELARLDYMQSALAKGCDAGDTYSIMAALKIMETRAKYIPTLMPKEDGGGGDGAGVGGGIRPHAHLTNEQLQQRIQTMRATMAAVQSIQAAQPQLTEGSGPAPTPTPAQETPTP
jgi:hypothetical protein